LIQSRIGFQHRKTTVVGTILAFSGLYPFRLAALSFLYVASLR